MPELLPFLWNALLAAGIGALVGLQREQAAHGVLPAGARTFPLVAIFGAVTTAYFPDLLPFAFAGVVILSALGYVAKLRADKDPGLATAVAMLLVFVYGALTVLSDEARVLAVVLGASTTVVLALKSTLHGFAKRISAEEGRAMLTFLVAALVVLPLLPDEPVDALLGLNPRFAWLMVVLVSGIDLVAYLGVRLFETRSGHLLAGVVGGLVSSTATTVAMSRRARGSPDLYRWFRISIVVAQVVMLARILLEVAVVDPALMRLLALPFGLMAALFVAATLVWLRSPARQQDAGPPPRNPFRMTPALVFGAFFAVTLLATAWINQEYGKLGLYGASFLTGAVDVDAVTLSLGRLAAQGKVDREAAASGIVLVACGSFVAKLLIVGGFGTARLLRHMLYTIGAAPIIGLAFVLAWNVM